MKYFAVAIATLFLATLCNAADLEVASSYNNIVHHHSSGHSFGPHSHIQSQFIPVATPSPVSSATSYGKSYFGYVLKVIKYKFILDLK